jgi:hypothetical protein
MDVSKINDYLNPSSAKGKVGGRNLGKSSKRRGIRNTTSKK